MSTDRAYTLGSAVRGESILTRWSAGGPQRVLLDCPRAPAAPTTLCCLALGGIEPLEVRGKGDREPLARDRSAASTGVLLSPREFLSVVSVQGWRVDRLLFNLSLLDLGLVRMFFDSAGEDSALWLVSPSAWEGGCSGGRRSHHGVCD